jgi:erythronate-4-phosphate dehydrogenase
VEIKNEVRSKVKLVADENIPFLRGVLDPYAEVTYLPGKEIDSEAVRRADGLIIRTRTQCDRTLLEGSKVRFIATATIGYDHIDTAYCDESGIGWFHAAGCNASGVEQYIAAALLHLAITHNFRLEGKVLGVVGVGNVGSRIVRIGKALGMMVLQNDPPRARLEGEAAFTDLRTIREESDIITLHIPLTTDGPDRTLNLADKGFLSDLKKKPIIINTSRGEVVDEKELMKHLQSRMVSGVVLDVWQNEPGISLELLVRTDIGTPHIAGYSTEGKANGTAFCVRQASQFFGFGLDSWYPDPLLSPPSTVLNIDPSGRYTQDILQQAIRFSYDILRDDRNLRTAPATFEKLRNHYPVRREFPSFTIKLTQQNPETARLLTSIGFVVI